MPGVARTYTYQLERPENTLVLVAGLTQAAKLIHKHNKWVEKIEISHPEDGSIIIRLSMIGHDQWQIKKKVIYPLAALLSKAGIQLKDARLLAVDKPPDTRSTRPRASDGRSRPLHPDDMIDHSDMMA